MCTNNVPAVLLLANGTSLNIGKCARNEHDAFYNQEVQNPVVANTGVRLHLSEAALQEIRAIYDGKPLLIRFAFPKDCCGGCKNCCAGFCCFSCGNCDCTWRSMEMTSATHIWFGRESHTSRCDLGLLGPFLCMNYCNSCCLPQKYLLVTEVTLHRDTVESSVVSQPKAEY